MVGKVISFINMKGGVGKTTLTIGAAKRLSEDGKKVLLIDIDPQFNATQTFIEPEKYELLGEKTIYKLFTPQTNLKQTSKIPKFEEISVDLSESGNTLMLIPGDLNLVLANNVSDPSLVKRLKNFIKQNSLREKFDYILIDNPPTLTNYTTAALFASDYYVIPNRIDRYSIKGIESLNFAVESIVENEELSLKNLGIVYTMVENNMTQKTIDLKARFEEGEVANNLYIFRSTQSFVRDLQVGKSGANPVTYQTSNKDIADFVFELTQRILTVEEGNDE